HRNLGVFTTRNIPLYRLFAQWQGRRDGFTKGRDRSFHFGTQDFKIIGMISHLGPQMGVANGIALADLLRGKHRVTAVFTGEGGTSEGDFHEAMNLAAVWDLPVLFCIENNGYGISTPTHEQYRCRDLAGKGTGYGMESHILDGNNIMEVFIRIDEICKSIRKDPRPVLIEFKTFRMRGHEEASGTKYVPRELLETWERKDPILNFERFLLDEKILTKDLISTYKNEIQDEIDHHLKKALKGAGIESDVTNELNDVYRRFDYQEIDPGPSISNIRLVDAVSQGLKQSMERHPELVVMGQDIAEYGGVFKVTEGFVDAFGRQRVRNTPICESGIVSTAMGLSIQGIKSVVEMQFSDFVSSGFN